jgi:hypothetical protein
MNMGVIPARRRIAPQRWCLLVRSLQMSEKVGRHSGSRYVFIDIALG